MDMHFQTLGPLKFFAAVAFVALANAPLVLSIDMTVLPCRRWKPDVTTDAVLSMANKARVEWLAVFAEAVSFMSISGLLASEMFIAAWPVALLS
jgi:hypothetical protein